MRASDTEFISSTPLNYGAYLERVINAGGVPYSCVIYQGCEVCNMPTAEEKRLIDYWENEAHTCWEKSKLIYG